MREDKNSTAGNTMPVKLPTGLNELIITLHHSPETAIKHEALKMVLAKAPRKDWVKKHPVVDKAEYLPIDKVEHLLDTIFQQWQIQVVKTGIIFNALEVTVRVHYRHPVDGNWYYHDGVAAKELQTKSGTGVLKPDFSNVVPGAVEKALPIAKSMAMKDACDHLGALFGRNLNRKDIVEFTPVYGTPGSKIDNVNNGKEAARVKEAIDRADTMKELDNLAEVAKKHGLDEAWLAKEAELIDNGKV